MEKKTYQIGKVKQLIDLNGDSTNFEIKFTVTSKDKTPFDALVVDQTTLDNTPNLSYQKVENGEITGEIKQDKNIYQNYFLVLRADTPCVCTVDIQKKELPKNIPQTQDTLPLLPKKNKNGFSWFNILLILGGVLVIGLGFYVYSKKTTENKSGFRFYSPPKFSGPTETFARPEFRPPRPISPSEPSLRPPKFTHNFSGNSSILDRLKNLDSD